jgi:hypothetical protein
MSRRNCGSSKPASNRWTRLETKEVDSQAGPFLVGTACSTVAGFKVPPPFSKMALVVIAVEEGVLRHLRAISLEEQQAPGHVRARVAVAPKLTRMPF